MNIKDIIEAIDENTTICGYNARELIIFADACKKHDISPEMMHDFCALAESAYNYIMDEFLHAMDNVLLNGSEK